MKTILLPYDGSEPAKRAVQYLLELAKEAPVFKVDVLNVQHDPRHYGGGGMAVASILPQLRQEAYSKAQELADEAVSQLKQGGIEATAHAAVGNLVQEVERLIGESASQAIVMGTRGMGGIGNLFLGSAATQVIHSVQIPVTLIK